MDENKIVFYDTETTGLPDWKTPSGGENQPHIVQLGVLLVDADTRKIIDSMDVIVKPSGWEIPQEMTDIHGITQEQALEEGIPEQEALIGFLNMCGDHDLVAHNRTFDKRIIRIATKRYCNEDTIQHWAGNKEQHACTMLMANKIMKIGKMPSLEEAYKHFTGKELEGSHNALVDAKACMEIYWIMKDKENEKDK